MNFEEFLVHPLFLMGVGTVVSYFVGTKLTRKYQEQQKKRDIEREDLHRSISIKDDLIRQLSDAIAILDQIVVSVYLLHEEDKTKDWLEVLVEDFQEFQKITGKLMLLINLYFGAGNKITNEISTFAILGLTIKNYGVVSDEQTREELKNKIIKYVAVLVPNDRKTISEQEIKEMGIPVSFYSEVTTKFGAWAINFSKELLETKLKKYTN